MEHLDVWLTHVHKGTGPSAVLPQEDAAWDPASAAVNTAFTSGGYAAGDGSYAADTSYNGDEGGYGDDGNYADGGLYGGGEGYYDDTAGWGASGGSQYSHNWQNGNNSGNWGGGRNGNGGGNGYQYGGGHRSRYKSALCRPFMTYGHCPNGYNCGFAHGQHELVSRMCMCDRS